MNITTYKEVDECSVYTSRQDGRVILTLWETRRARPFDSATGRANAYLRPAQARIVATALVEYANEVDRSQENEVNE